MQSPLLLKKDEKEPANSDKIIIVALDPIKNEDFEKLTADEKFKKIQDAIQFAYHKIKEIHPNAKEIIIAWREFMITPPDHRAVDQSFAADVKMILRNITKVYPDLTIVAGGMLIKKERAKKEKYAQPILNTYGYYKNKFAQDIMENSDTHFETHYKNAESVLKFSYESLFTKVKSNAYVAHAGIIKRHGKLAPINELEKDMHLENSVFQLGKGPDDDSAVVRLPDLPSILIHNCREHFFTIGDDHADFHFILSDSIYTRADKIAKEARVAIAIDSLMGVKAYTTSTQPKQTQIYQYNFLTDKSLQIIQPTQPLYCKLMNFLTKAEHKSSASLIELVSEMISRADVNLSTLLKFGSEIGELMASSQDDPTLMDILHEIPKIIFDHFQEYESPQYAEKAISLINLQIDEGKKTNLLLNRFKYLSLYSSTPIEPTSFSTLPSTNISSNLKDKYSEVQDSDNDDSVEITKSHEALYMAVALYSGDDEERNEIKKLINLGADPNYAPDQNHPHLTTLAVAEMNFPELLDILKPTIRSSQLSKGPL